MAGPGRRETAVLLPAEGRGALRVRRAVGDVAQTGRRSARLVYHPDDRGQRPRAPGPRTHAGDPAAAVSRRMARPGPPRAGAPASAAAALWWRGHDCLPGQRL